MSVRLDHGEDTLADIHEINVTPFIDVMLVLLIIFMVAAPLATVDVAVNLPTTAAEAQPQRGHGSGASCGAGSSAARLSCSPMPASRLR
jgi:biopolymer transport protein ExbD